MHHHEHEPTPTELHAYLDDIDYPTTREQLIAAAVRHGAGEDVLHRLRNIEDIEYDTRDAVSAAVTFLGDTTINYGHVTVYDQ